MLLFLFYRIKRPGEQPVKPSVTKNNHFIYLHFEFLSVVHPIF